MKKVLVLGATLDHKLLIEKLIHHGFWVILVDFSTNPVAKNSAHEYFQISTTNIPLLKQLVIDNQVKLIFSACVDSSLEPALVLSNQLELPHHFDLKKLAFISDKGLMKSLFANHQIPSSKYIVLQEGQIEELVNWIFPLVVKPIGTSSSKGVLKINDLSEVNAALREAFKLTKGNQVVLEEFVSGNELTVDIWVTEGKPMVIMISKISKSVENPDQFTINSNQFDPLIFKELFIPISAIAEKLVDALGYNSGPLMFQVIHGEQGFSVLEMSVRMGGGSKINLVKAVTGVDLLEAYISLYLNINYPIKPAKCDHYLEIVYLYAENGCIAVYGGMDEAKSEGLIEDYFIYKLEGSNIYGSTVSSDRPAAVMIKANSCEELEAKKSKIFDVVSILDNNGKDLLKKWF